jgi:hypothetical protein
MSGSENSSSRDLSPITALERLRREYDTWQLARKEVDRVWETFQRVRNTEGGWFQRVAKTAREIDPTIIACTDWKIERLLSSAKQVDVKVPGTNNND